LEQKKINIYSFLIGVFMNPVSFHPLIVIFIGICFIAFSSLAEAYELRERYIEENPVTIRMLSSYWHWFQFFERLFAILFGYSLAYSDSPVLLFFFIASLFWIVYDAAINFALNRYLFDTHINSVSPFDLVGNKFVKFIVLLISLFLLVW